MGREMAKEAAQQARLFAQATRKGVSQPILGLAVLIEDVPHGPLPVYAAWALDIQARVSLGGSVR
jgi:hypothetical protein